MSHSKTEEKKNVNPGRPEVSVWCVVYNHAPYLRECLDGIVNQRTNFKFEIIVHDDASTDDSINIIKEYQRKYPDIIKPILEEENQYSKGKYNVSKIMFSRTKGRMIAYCEGDDYWSDPNKLQTQYDYLRHNPSVKLCYTKADRYNHSLREFCGEFGNERNRFEEMIVSNPIPTVTLMTYRRLFRKYFETIRPEEQEWLMGDYPYELWVAANYKVGFIDKVTSVYRILQNSASNSTDILMKEKFIDSYFNIKRYFADRYGIQTKIDLKELHQASLARNAYVMNDRKRALFHLKRKSRKDLKTLLRLLTASNPLLFSKLRKYLAKA